MSRKFTLILLALVIGLVIRAYKITSLPLYGDELTLVYDSYSILKTSHDQTGAFLPLTFKMGAGRPGGYIYASLPFVALFGPSELGVRSLSLLSGIGIIVLMYFLGKKLFNDRVGIIASLLTAIYPWDIYLSRGGFEAHFALFLALLGIVSFLYARKNQKYFILWALSWGLAIFTYPTYKLTLPLIFLLLVWYEKDFKKLFSNKFFISSLFVLSIFAGIAIRETLAGGSENRFLNINVFQDEKLTQGIIQNVNNERNLSTLPKIIRPLFYNRTLEYGKVFLDKYSQSLSFKFLFLSGDGNPRHNPGELGMLYLIELPLLIIALKEIISKDKRKFILVLGIIAITPLATMLLSDPYHSLRNALMIPGFIILDAYALSLMNKRILKMFSILFLIQLIFILQRLYFLDPNKFASFWSASAKMAVTLAQKESGNYDTIFISNKIDNAEFAYPVYSKVDPNYVIAQYGMNPKVYRNVVIGDLVTDEKYIKGKTLLVEDSPVNSYNLLPGVVTRVISDE